MSGPKTDKDVAYAEGYEAGRNSSWMDDFSMSMAGGVVGSLFDGPNQDVYDAGYAEGQKDRNESD